MGHVAKARCEGSIWTCCEGSTYVVETKGSNSFRGLRGCSVPRVARALLGTRGLKLVDPIGQGI